MPIKIPNDLPARNILEQEGVNVIKETDAIRQDIRPLRIALLNLMPNKIRTETQFARLTGSTPLQVELTLLHTGSYRPKNTPERHLLDFYRTWEQVRDEKFDGLIVTGAPVETMPFEAGRLLAGADPDHRLGPDQRPAHLLRLLGRPGRALPLVRRAQVRAGPEDVRGLPARRS